MNANASREQILQRLEEWLDKVLKQEEPPQGIDAEVLAETAGTAEEPAEEDARSDAYALWSSMTALTQEVRLQGRTFKQLTEALASDPRQRDREREIRQEAERRSRKEMLGTLLDLRDSLERGLDAVRRGREAPQPLMRRVLLRLAGQAGQPAAVEALEKGYRLTVERLDQALEEMNVRPIECQGRPFDPQRMNAVDIEETTAHPEGSVIEVYRSGYEWNGEIFRTAQVKVARGRKE